MPLRRPTLAALLLPIALGCGGVPNPDATPAPARYDRNRISEEEVNQARTRGVRDAYDLVRSLRPQWLRTSGSGFGGRSEQIAVYMDNSRLDNPQLRAADALRQIPLTNIGWMRWLSASEAGGMFGMDVNYGAIQIVTLGSR